MSIRNWKFYAGRLMVLALLVLLAGWLSGQWAIVLVVVLIAFCAWHLVNALRLHSWLRSPLNEIPGSTGIWSDIFDGIRAVEQRNHRQKEKYDSAIGEFQNLTNAFPDAALLIDQDDRISWSNDAARSLLSLNNPGDLGQPVTNLLRGPDFANWLVIEREVNSPLEMMSPKDENIWLLVTAVPMGDEQRLIILRDYTQVHIVEQIRRDFVANISHELRTPLTVIKGYLELLQQGSTGNVTTAVGKMSLQADQMQALLDDLLELSRVQNDKNQGQETSISVSGVLMRLKGQAEEISRGRHELFFDLDELLYLSGISSDLESAFSNLITNALKYTPHGGRIAVSWQDSPEGPKFQVQDNGMGIPARDIPRLTERFYRVGSDRARKTGGTGLGLAIVKHVLNAHQAELIIESELGEGSTFTCTFPQKRKRDTQ